MNSTIFIQPLRHSTGIELVQAIDVRLDFPRHLHTTYCIGLIESGARRCFIRGRWHLIPAGQIVVINPGEAHACGSADVSGHSYQMFCVPGEFMAGVIHAVSEKREGIPFFPEAAIDNPLLFADLHDFANKVTGTLPILEIETLFLILMARLVRRYAQEPLDPSPAVGNLTAIRRTREFIDTYSDQDIRIDDLVAVSCLSSFHLIHLFTRQVGVPPHTYQTLTRLRHARKLLRSGVPIADAAVQTGFFDQSHLTNTFKRYVGVTPRQFVDMGNGEPGHHVQEHNLRPLQIEKGSPLNRACRW